MRVHTPLLANVVYIYITYNTAKFGEICEKVLLRRIIITHCVNPTPKRYTYRIRARNMYIDDTSTVQRIDDRRAHSTVSACANTGTIPALAAYLAFIFADIIVRSFRTRIHIRVFGTYVSPPRVVCIPTQTIVTCARTVEVRHPSRAQNPRIVTVPTDGFSLPPPPALRIIVSRH